MKAWEKANEKYSALRLMDFVALCCPDALKVGTRHINCCRTTEQYTDTEKICQQCWEQEVEENDKL